MNAKNPTLYYAGFLKRAGASVADFIILTLVIIFLGYILRLVNLYNKNLDIAVIIAYFVIFFGSKWNATPGKILFKIQVIRKDGEKIKSLRGAVRALIPLIFIIIFALVFSTIIFEIANSPQKTLSDEDIMAMSIISTALALITYFIICFITIISSKQKITIHDLICGTRVIQTTNS